MPHARNESPVTGRIADFRLQRLIAVAVFGHRFSTNIAIDKIWLQNCISTITHLYCSKMRYDICSTLTTTDVAKLKDCAMNSINLTIYL